MLTAGSRSQARSRAIATRAPRQAGGCMASAAFQTPRAVKRDCFDPFILTIPLVPAKMRRNVSPALARSSAAATATARSRRSAAEPKQAPRATRRHVARPEVIARNPVHVVLRVDARGRQPAHASRLSRDPRRDRHVRRAHRLSRRPREHPVESPAPARRGRRQARALTRHAGLRDLRREAAQPRAPPPRAATSSRSAITPRRSRRPTQARNAIAYVLNNWRRHANDLRSPYRIDLYSSAEQFPGWETPHGYAPRARAAAVRPRRRRWLLTDGWTRAGPIPLDEIPGPDPTP